MPSLKEVKVKITTESDNRGVKEAENSISSFSKGTVAASQVFTAGILAAGAAATAFGVSAVGAFAKMEQQEVAFTTLLGSAEKAGVFMEKLREDSRQSPFEPGPIFETNQALLGAGLAAESARTSVVQLGNVLSATGKGDAELKRIGNTISQVFGKGKANSVDFQEMVNAGWVSVRQDVSTTLGVTMDQMDFMISEGKIGFEELSQTLEKVAGSGGKFGNAAAEQATTINGLMSTLKGEITFAMADIGKALAEAFDLQGIMADAIPAIQQFVVVLRDQIIPFLKENQGLMVIFAGVLVALMAPAFMTAAQAAAPLVLNMIALAAPIILVGALIAGLYLAWNNNWFGIRDITNSVVSWFQNTAWPIMQSIFTAMGAALTILGQVWNNIWNLIIKPLLNLFVAWFQNTFWTPIKTVFNLIDGALKASGHSWEDVWNGIKSTVFGILGLIVNEVKSRVNMIISIINAMISGANSAGEKIPNYTKINNIPQLAKGTDNFAGGIALVGERGPELVNLPRGSQVIPNNQLTSGAGGVSMQNTFNVYSDLDLEQGLRDIAFSLETA